MFVNIQALHFRLSLKTRSVPVIFTAYMGEDEAR